MPSAVLAGTVVKVSLESFHGFHLSNYSFSSEIHAYDNSAFNNGNNSHEMEERRADSKAEVERMGYEMYNGNKHENR